MKRFVTSPAVAALVLAGSLALCACSSGDTAAGRVYSSDSVPLSSQPMATQPASPPPSMTASPGAAPYSGPGRLVSTKPVGTVVPGYRDEMGDPSYRGATAAPSSSPAMPPSAPSGGPAVSVAPPPPPPSSSVGSPDGSTMTGPTPAVPATPQPATPAPAPPTYEPTAPPVAPPAPSAVYATGFHWAPTLAAAQAEARATGKLIFIETGRESCGNCQKLRKTIIPEASSALGAIAVGYYDDCDVDRGSQAFWILRNKLPNAVTLPLAGFVTADLNWVSGFSGHTEADRFASEMEKARSQR